MNSSKSLKKAWFYKIISANLGEGLITSSGKYLQLLCISLKYDILRTKDKLLLIIYKIHVFLNYLFL